MKKRFKIAFSVILSLGLIGCSSNGSTVADTTSTTTSVVAQTSTQPVAISTVAAQTSKATETEEKLIGIALSLTPDLYVLKPDSIGNIYVDATVGNSTNFPIVAYQWTFKDKITGEKHYLTTYDTIMPGERSSKMSTFGPKSGKVEDMEPLVVEFKIRFDKEVSITYSYDYKLKEITFYQ